MQENTYNYSILIFLLSEKSNQEVVDAYNNLTTGSLSNTVGNTALSTGLADKFDIIISALLGVLYPI